MVEFKTYMLYNPAIPFVGIHQKSICTCVQGDKYKDICYNTIYNGEKLKQPKPKWLINMKIKGHKFISHNIRQSRLKEKLLTTCDH